MKHIKKICRFCKNRFYTDDHKQYFCNPEHARIYHIKQCNLKLSITRTENMIEKYKTRLEKRKLMLKRLEQFQKRVGTKRVWVEHVD